jgi:hypothetical protein
MTDLTPESEYLVATIDEDTTLDELRSHLVAIEAAAIARDREGLVEPFLTGLRAVVRRELAWAGMNAYERRARADIIDIEARRLLALDAPEAQA